MPAATSVITSSQSITLKDMIIDQPGNPVLNYTGSPSGLDIQYLLASEANGLPDGIGVVVGAPAFVDPAHGNYRLQRTSLGIDFSPPLTGDDRDLDELPRDQGLPDVPDFAGVRDLGAYEHQRSECVRADTIFCHGFE